eukprot:m.529361 g.529361  ORF g.529361 m.529361 type:complete len:56 (+) comp191090_c0_seq1:3-170(+)
MKLAKKQIMCTSIFSAPHFRVSWLSNQTVRSTAARVIVFCFENEFLHPHILEQLA